MTPGDVQAFQIAASLAVSIPALFVVIVRDERRLTAEQLVRAWPPASRDAAIFLLTLGAIEAPFLCIFIHFVRTRRSVLGVVHGLAWVAAFLGLEVGSQLAVAAAVDWLGL